MIKIALGSLAAALGFLWAWAVLNAPAVAAHPWWIARQEAMYLSGLLSIGLMSLAMYLATRPVWLETPLGGMDRVYRTHKWAGILGGSFAILHWLAEMSGDLLKSTIGRAGRLPKIKPDGLLGSLQHLAKDFGEWGFYILIALLAITLWKRFPYRPWRFLHRAMPVIYLMLAFHAVLWSPRDYWLQPVGWLLGLLIVAGVYGALRALLGNIGQSRRSTGEILTVTQPTADVLSVQCRLSSGWPGHQPGQFVLLTFDSAEGAHPFTIASADRGDGTLDFQIKALGDYTKKLAGRLRAGQAIRVEGPYGRFDIARLNHQAQQVWVAAGIGVTPFLAWLAFLQKNPQDAPAADLHYCTRDRETDPFVEKLQTLSASLPSIRLHLYGDRQSERLDGAKLLPAGKTSQPTEIWFCGPNALAAALRKGLPATGAMRFHQEAFEMR